MWDRVRCSWRFHDKTLEANDAEAEFVTLRSMLKTSSEGSNLVYVFLESIIILSYRAEEAESPQDYLFIVQL